MSSNFQGNPNTFLPQDYIFPTSESDFKEKLRYYLNEMSFAVNTKDSGVYDAVETVTGQKFLPTFSTESSSSTNYRSVLRKVVDFGSLPNAGTKSVAHGITLGSTLSVTQLYAAATNPSTSWIPIPYASPTAANNIELNVDSTNINIITGSNRTAYTRCFVVIEYITTV